MLAGDADKEKVLRMYKEAEGVIRSTGKNVKIFMGSAKDGIRVMDALAALDDQLLVPRVCNV